MSFYDDASLVVIPSAQKTSKLYAVKPTDGSGDLTFTRTGDTATRVNSAGLIEKVRTNVLLHSQTLNNAVWSLSAATITANGTAAPDGTTTADKLIPSAGADPSAANATQLQQVLAVASNTYTFSIYAKAAGQNSVRIRENNSWGNFLNLNLTTGAFNIIGGNFGQFNNVQVETLANGWYRLSFTTEAGVTNFSKYSIRGGETGDGTSGVFLWGAQLEVSDFGATPYIATTTAAVSVGPVANVPRLDYLGSTCPRLLLEPQRTNLVTYSEQFDNASWLKYRLDLGTNTQVSPSGVQNADTFTSSIGETIVPAIARTAISFIGNTRYSQSLFVKKIGTTNSFKLTYVDNATGYVGGSATYNVSTQVITISQSANNSVTASMEDYGNGWYRLILNFLTIATPTFNYIEYSISTANTANTFAIWGAQLEVGAYATSIIPTLAATATRGADACLKTGISSLIGQTEGVLFAEFNVLNINPANVSRIILSDGTTSNYIFLGINESGSGNLSRLFINNTAASFSLSLFSSTAITVGLHKLALAYKSGSFALYLDGNSVASSATTGTIPATSQLVIGGTTPTAASNLETLTLLQTLLFPTRLTNASLAELTTL